ncbi:MAG: ubiquitin-conjugating enzyme family protein [Candidatus Helarchaeota archaeon]
MDESRLTEELLKIEKELPLFTPVEGDLTHYEGWILGPVGSPYEGKFFRVMIRLPPDFPFVPPQIQFLSKIWHPNINPNTGEICNDILKISGEGEFTWSPGSDIVSVIMNIIGMLGGNFNFNSPLNPEASREFRKSKKQFEKKAREWALKYGQDYPNL